MEKHPLVSFLVPCYNHQKYIEKTLNSIIAEEYPNAELIVLDDGSSDRSFEIAENWGKTHPGLAYKLIRRENRGVCATMNELLSLSRGTYIRYCASDDLIESGSTTKMIRALKLSGKRGAFGDCVVINDDGHEISSSSIAFKKSTRQLYEKHLLRAIVGNWAIVGPSILYSRDAFSNGGFDENLVVEDWDFYLRLLASNELTFIPEVVAKYRVHGNNASITSNLEARLRNLSSQLQAAENNIPRFKVLGRMYLRAQSWLLRAKICYLRRKFLIGAIYLGGYYLLSHAVAIFI